VVNGCTRDFLALIAGASLSGAPVTRELAALFDLRGKPKKVVRETGTELTSNAILTCPDPTPLVSLTPETYQEQRQAGSNLHPQPNREERSATSP